MTATRARWRTSTELDFAGTKTLLVLSPDGGTLTNSTASYNGLHSIPWHPRCKPGEILVPDRYYGGTDFSAAQCYDNSDAWDGWRIHYVPGTTGPMSTPTTITASKACETPGYDEDESGRNCRPKWTGKYVWGQTDWNQYPFLVTDCSIRTCPAGFTKNGCTCTANITRNPNFRSLAGTGTPPVK